ncbi:MAG: type 1 pili tip component [Ectothiorhodospiraceae bacterium]|nr:type 1 pili tip component [Ectothiorhodospiraceae bacterium]MCH8504403.1 type 1 pili tip component [Ectothiorhodospiraceae bacterium]
MKVKQLIEAWEESASEIRTANEYRVKLPIHDAAKLSALREMFPGRSESDLITDLLSAALDDLEAAFPYVQGQRIVAEDEHGDPIYEDVGDTPRFRELSKKHLAKLQQELTG